MNTELETKIQAQMVAQYEQAITEAWGVIMATMAQASLNSAMAEKDTLKFPVTSKTVLEMAGDNCRVSMSISCGSRARLSIDAVTVTDQPELFAGGEGA